MRLREEQQRHIESVAEWAQKIRMTLGETLEAHGSRVHFRPGSTGVAMIGLLSSAPQRGRSGFTDLEQIALGFEALFAEHCTAVPEKPTPEKSLQSWLISEAHRHGRRLRSINAASVRTGEPVELAFVTDEVALPAQDRKIVCDILALRRDGNRCTPALIELKSARQLTRLIEQIESYAELLDEHARAFEKLFEAVLGEPIHFDAPAERWLVWPSAGQEHEGRHEQALAEKRIRVVEYTLVDGEYGFRVGRGLGPR